MDITDLNPALHAYPAIIKLVGDANTAALLQEAALAMGEGPIDLLYVDADHRFLSTLTNLGLYVLAFNPRLVVIDDIVLNENMRPLWNFLRATRGAEAINCVDVVPEIRSPNVGFGLLRLR